MKSKTLKWEKGLELDWKGIIEKMENEKRERG